MNVAVPLFLLLSRFCVFLAVRSAPFCNASQNINSKMELDQQLGLGNMELPGSTVSLLAPQQLSSKSGPAMLLIGAIDGTLTAFSAALSGLPVPLWTLDTRSGPLLSSSLSKIELVKNGVKIQLIPSLDGGLFSFDGDKIESLPVSADTLLSSSFKISEDSVVTGGKETKVYGIDAGSGKLKYSCGVNGCSKYEEEVEGGSGDGTLLVSRRSQTVRAFNVHQGQESWNFSVGSLDLGFATGSGDAQRATGAFPKSDCVFSTKNDITAVNKNVDFRFDVATGVVQAVVEDGNDQQELWRHQFKQPITSAWILRNGCIRPLDLLTDVPFIRDPYLLSPESANQLIYIGQYDEQLYIQRARRVVDAHLQRRFPHVSFRPLLINAASRTPAISEAYRPLIEASQTDSPGMKTPLDNNALLAIDYPFDGGYYLASDETFLNGGSAEHFHIENDGVQDGTFLMLFVRRWRELTGLMVLPVILSVSISWLLCRKKNPQRKMLEPLVLVVKPELERQDTTSTKSLTSILSQQEISPRISRFRSDFEVLSKLGKGGFGEVYTAKHRLNDIVYAVKKIDLPRSEAAREKVRREVRVLAKLEHVGIVRFYNAWVEIADPISISEPDPDEDIHLPHNKNKKRFSFEPTSMSSCTSADLNRDWIGTQRINEMSRSGNLKLDSSLILKPQNGLNSPDESLDIVFEGSNHVSEVPEPATPVYARQRKPSRSSTKKSTPSLSGLSDLESDESGAESTDAGPHPKPQLFIQMELCHKETLRDWLRIHCETRNRNHILDIFYQIVSAVEYIHSKGLMHRDLKPSNILFSVDGTAVKIGDFGLVTSTDDDEVRRAIMPEENYLSVHGHTNQVGTSLYMSPELERGKVYDEKVDMYSLGLILFELLVPFRTEMERVYSIVDAKLLKISPGLASSRSCSISEDEIYLRRLLSVNPAERPSASELRNCDMFHDLILATHDENGFQFGMRGRTISGASDIFQGK